MPRLGDSSSNNNNDADTRRNAAMAYQQARNRYPLSNFLLLLFITLILRNMFFHDYRKEEISSLQASGKSPEQIAKVVPESAAEKKQHAHHASAAHHHHHVSVSDSDFDILKKEVQVLKDEVALLRAQAASAEMDSEDDMDTNEESDHAPPPKQDEIVEDEIEIEEEAEEEQEEEEEEVQEDFDIVEEPRPVAVAHHAKTKPKTNKLRGSTAKKVAGRKVPVSTKKRVPKKTTTRKKVVKKTRADPVVV